MITVSTSTNAAMSAYAAAVDSKSANTRQQVGQDETAQIQTSNTDSVSLSSTSTDYNSSIVGNAPYFPVRAGMNADALVLGASKPGAVSSSKDKTFPEVAADARKRMDEKYAQMTASGQPYAKTDEDRNALFGDLDRRSLNAVATNEGGKFTADEQASAQALMRQQGRLATGYYSGPADQEKNWKDSFANDPVARAHAALDFLDNMSPEEKNTPQWLTQHLSLEAALNQSAGSDPADKKSGHFHNLAEILAGVVTDGSDKKTDDAKTADPLAHLLDTLQTQVS
ncbi:MULTISPECIES: hypothetical protein [Pseudomonas]|uniref:hypothetical protein n=1 Tax=Pseudomonas TaxID=286 RepID=UPI0005FB0EA2|nr:MULTISPECIES: hypothetical protein [Pseudomonas]KJZ36911.1 hypothetical protein VC33_13945 [Pseudomonas fluorescens]OOG14988.1 hypothetical protein BMS17_23820 [Pseudomonas sp. C9]